MFDPLESVEVEAGPLLIRAAVSPCQEPETCECPGIVWLIASVPDWELDRWALVGIQPPPLDVESLEDAYSGLDDRELGCRFVAAFGVRWVSVCEAILKGQRRLWRTEEVLGWLNDAETTCEQLLTLRRYTGDRPSVAARAIVTMADYRRLVQ